ncbi:hypothetical protein QDX27_07565 [Rhizobium sp. BR 318]
MERRKMIGIDRRTAETIAFDKATRTGSFLFHAHDRHSCQVTVTRRSILTAALPPRDGALRFLECMDVFAAIASEKLLQLGAIPALRITAEDVRLWQRLGGRMATNRQDKPHPGQRQKQL